MIAARRTASTGTHWELGLFPGARLHRGRLLGWPKSFVVVHDGRTER